MNNQIANIEELIDHLEKLGKGEIPPLRHHHGICTELEYAAEGLGDMYDFVTVRSLGWAAHSGDELYPVPHPLWRLNASRGFASSPYRWATNEYGDLRRDLCLHLAKSLRENPEKDW